MVPLLLLACAAPSPTPPWTRLPARAVTRPLTHGGMVPFLVSPDGTAVQTFEGLTVQAPYSFADHPRLKAAWAPTSDRGLVIQPAETAP